MGEEVEIERKEAEGEIGGTMRDKMTGVTDQGKSKEQTRQMLNLIRMFKSFTKRLIEAEMWESGT